MRVFVFSLVLGLGCVASVSAMPPSPAGGGYFTLGAPGDYAFAPDRLDFDFHLGRKGFTVELWFYLNRPLKKVDDATGEPGEIWAFVYKAGSYEIGLAQTEVLVRMKGPGYSRSTGFLGSPDEWLPINQWHYIAIMFDADSYQEVANTLLKGQLGGYQGFVNTPSRLCIGGAREPVLSFDPGARGGGQPSTPFTAGAIDEVRISSIVRYPRADLAHHFWQETIEVPRAPFDPDEHTVALWHFDGWGEAERLMDASGNGHHLTYHGKSFAVRPRGKLTTTWGAIKQR